jgi:hypothetical protein
MPPLSFQSLGIFRQLQLITLILVICFVGSTQIGVPLTVNWFGTTIIANDPKWTLRIGMRKTPPAIATRGPSKKQVTGVFSPPNLEFPYFV